jgi:hypothetical protein
MVGKPSLPLLLEWIPAGHISQGIWTPSALPIHPGNPFTLKALDVLNFLLCLWQMDVLFMITGGEPFQKLEVEPLASVLANN